jgi:hypothetical protein
VPSQLLVMIVHGSLNWVPHVAGMFRLLTMQVTLVDAGTTNSWLYPMLPVMPQEGRGMFPPHGQAS